jgi:hypothetical protein
MNQMTENVFTCATRDGQLTLACVVCGGAFESNPKVQRAFAGSEGDPETPHLCWICTRLHHSALWEAEEVRRFFGAG